MSNSNNDLTAFTDADRKECILSLQQIEEKLSPHLRSLTVRERKQTVKVGDKSAPFVAKAIQFAGEFPDAIPNVIRCDQIEKDFIKTKEIDFVIRKTEKILDGLKDARLLAASDSYTGALKIYHAIRSASDIDLPGITAAVEELSKRFHNQGRRSDNNANTKTAITASPGTNNGAVVTEMAGNGLDMKTPVRDN